MNTLLKSKSILAGLFVLALGVGASLTVFAQTSTTVGPPSRGVTNTSPLEIRPIDPAGVDITTLTQGGNDPSATPGNISGPAPRFSAINSPVWLTTQDTSLQVANDMIIHGFVDARMGVVNTVQNADTPILESVTIFDDLYVGGNGTPEEPGNIVIDGSIRAGSTTSVHQITGDLNVISGDVTVAGALNIVGAPNTVHTIGSQASSANVTVYGSVTATSIGRYYSVLGPTLNPLTTLVWTTTPSTASCSAGDILLSCSATYSGILPSSTRGAEWYSQVTGLTCNVQARRLSSTGSDHTVGAWASCFSPDG